MSDDRYFETAKRAREEAEKKLGGYRGDCSDCKYSQSHWLGGICHHPAVTLVSFNLTDAYDKKRILQCAEQRDQSSVYGPVVCGPNGILFEERQRLWHRILAVFGNFGRLDPNS